MDRSETRRCSCNLLAKDFLLYSWWTSALRDCGLGRPADIEMQNSRVPQEAEALFLWRVGVKLEWIFLPFHTLKALWKPETDASSVKAAAQAKLSYRKHEKQMKFRKAPSKAWCSYSSSSCYLLASCLWLKPAGAWEAILHCSPLCFCGCWVLKPYGGKDRDFGKVWPFPLHIFPILLYCIYFLSYYRFTFPMGMENFLILKLEMSFN